MFTSPTQTHLSGPRQLALALGLAALAACSTAPPPVEKAAAPAAPLYKPEVSINQIMVSIIDHNSHILWNVSDAKRAPKTENDWHTLEHAAVTLAASGNMILMPGTGPNDAAWVKDLDWIQYTQNETSAAKEALAAIEAKDLNGVLAAGDKLVVACENCHEKFKKEIPKHVAKPGEQPEHFGH